MNDEILIHHAILGFTIVVFCINYLIIISFLLKFIYVLTLEFTLYFLCYEKTTMQSASFEVVESFSYLFMVVYYYL